MQAKLTKTAVDAATGDGADLWVWDTELKGFGLRVRPNGHKSYVIEYRPGDGSRAVPKRRLTIGPHGSPWTPATARAEAKRILGLVGQGKDPAAEKQAGKKAETMADLCAKFLSEHVALKTKPRTAAEYHRIIEKFILPALGARKVGDIVRQDVARIHHEHRATPYQANKTLDVMSSLMRWAEKVGLRPDGANPCQHIEAFPEERRERFLSADELGRLSEALAAYQGSPYAVAAIKLLVFTGARMGEVLGLRWHDIDFERGEVRLLDHKTSRKTGAKTLHLPPPALKVLADLPRIEGNPFVIVGGVPGAALVNLEKPWRAIRAVAGLDDVRLHDLRHAFASVAASSGLGLPIIGKMLGHSQPATTARYAHLAADPVKAAAAATAGKIEADMRGNRGEVVPMVRKTGAGH